MCNPTAVRFADILNAYSNYSNLLVPSPSSTSSEQPSSYSVLFDSDQTQQYSITMAITDGILIKVSRRRSPLPLPESRLSSAVVDAFSEQHREASRCCPIEELHTTASRACASTVDH
jgi:hypothetical protein